jgi:hypothetical protein
VAGRIRSMKSHSDHIGNGTRDIPACSAMPQPTARPFTLFVMAQRIEVITVLYTCISWFVCNSYTVYRILQIIVATVAAVECHSELSGSWDSVKCATKLGGFTLSLHVYRPILII